MKNAEYWRGRFAILEEATDSESAEYLQTIEREFRKASQSIQGDIERWYGRFAQNNEITLADAKKWMTSGQLSEFKWSVQDYIKAGESLNPQFLKQLENASARVHISRLESLQFQMGQQIELLYGNHLDSLDGLLRKVYSNGYYHTAFELQQGMNLGWDLQSLNAKQLRAVLSRPWSTDMRTFRDRCWTNKAELVGTVQTQLIQAIIRGDSPDKITKAIADRFNVSKNKAGRLAMTESAYFSSQAQKDCFHELGVEQYEIVSALDEHTCEICGGLDGKVFPLSDYEPGVTAHPFHPWCRCCTAPYFDDSAGERAARDQDGKTYYVPESMKYGDWKKSFVDGGSKDGLKPTTGNATIKNKTPFSPASTIKEAEEFARNTLEIQNASYKGVDVVTANAWNKGLRDTFDKFPQLKNQFGFVGECHERNIMLKPVTKQYYLDELGKLNPNASVTQLEPYADKYVNKLMRDMSVSKKTMAESWSPKLDVFEPFRGVTVNRDFGKNASLFVDSLKRTVESKFHPTGCNVIRSVLDHEIGHQLDDLLDISNMPDIQKLFDGKTHNELTEMLSEYTWNNSNPNKCSEMIAEAWAEYCNNPTPREIAKTVGQAIETAYKTKFGTS